MVSVELKVKEGLGLDGATVIVGFPSIGYAGVVAASYLASELDMEHVGSVVSRGLPPVASIHDYIPTHPLRIYARDKLMVIIADIPPPPDQMWSIGSVILKWLKEKEVGKVVLMEGLMPKDLEDLENMQAFAVGTTEGLRERLKELNIEQIQEGLITGVPGVLLAEGTSGDVDILCILSEAHPAFPDARAALRLIETMSRVYPGIQVDTKKLEENASEIEEKVRDSLVQAKELMDAREAQPSLPPAPQYMYR